MIKKEKLKLLHLIALICCLILLIVFLSYRMVEDYDSMKRSYFEGFRRYQKNSALSIAAILHEMINPNKELTITTAKKLFKSNVSDEKNIINILKEKSEGYSEIGGFYFGRESDGKHLSANIKPESMPKGYDPRKRKWYIEAAKAKRFIITEPYIDAITKKVCVTLADPVFKNGKLLGVVGLDIFVDNTKKIINAYDIGNDDINLIIDHKGNVIACNVNKIMNYNISKLISTINNDKFIIDDETVHIFDIGNLNNNKLYGSLYNIKEFNWTVITIKNPLAIKSQNQVFLDEAINKGAFLIMFIMLIILSAYVLYSISRKQHNHSIHITDTLTGLPNRYYLKEKYLKILDYFYKNGKVAFLFIDIDDFKMINDSLGHLSGDIVLRMISEFLGSNISPKDMLIRLDSDEFIIIMYDTDEKKAKEKADNIRKTVNEIPFEVNNQKLNISMSVGIFNMENEISLESLLSLANAVLTNSKKNSKNKTVYISNNQTWEVDERRKINKTITMIKNSLKNNKFELYLQPILNVSENKIEHYEALVRINDEGGLITPDKFIKIAENFGLVHLIDKWVFDKVIDILRKNPDVSIFINISPVTLNYDEVLEYFEKVIIQENKKSRIKLGIEITESAAIRNYGAAINWIKRLKKAGCTCSLDDFGVGYTSFSYLRELQADYVKIDGSFIKNIDTDNDHRAIVEAITKMVKSLGKQTVAEFVESEKIADILKDMGVDFGQGYYYSRPVASKDVF